MIFVSIIWLGKPDKTTVLETLIGQSIIIFLSNKASASTNKKVEFMKSRLLFG